MRYIIFLFILFMSNCLFSQKRKLMHVWIGKDWSDAKRYSLIRDSLVMDVYLPRIAKDSALMDSIKGDFNRINQMYYKVGEGCIELEIPFRGKIILNLNRKISKYKFKRIKKRPMKKVIVLDSIEPWGEGKMSKPFYFMDDIDPVKYLTPYQFKLGQDACHLDNLLHETIEKFTIKFYTFTQCDYVINGGYCMHKSLPVGISTWPHECYLLVQDTKWFTRYIYIDKQSCLPLGIVNIGKEGMHISYIYSYKALEAGYKYD